MSDEQLQRVAAFVDVTTRTLTVDRLAALGALLDRLHAFVSPERLARLAALVDQVPRLVTALKSGDAPPARELRQVPPDLHAMLELLGELLQLVTGLPGATLARDRGAAPHPQV